MHAGFWKRFGAFLIDSICIVFTIFLFILVWALFEIVLNTIGFEQKTKEIILGILGVPIYLSLPWLYYAFFESSKLKATVGKMTVGIIVLDTNNNRISFARASGRYWSKVISAVILLFGFFMAGFTSEKQALHDIISGTYVVNKGNPSQHYEKGAI